MVRRASYLCLRNLMPLYPLPNRLRRPPPHGRAARHTFLRASARCRHPLTMDLRRSAPAEILLVEDNPGDVRLMQEALKETRFGARLHVVRDGEEALAFLRREGRFQHAVRPSFVLLDLNLPRKSGEEVLG